MPPLTHPRRIDARRYRANIHNGALGRDDEVRKGLRHPDGAPDVDVVHGLCGLDVEIQGRHDDGLARIVDQVVQFAARGSVYFLRGDFYAVGGGGTEGEEGHVGEVFQVG